MNNPERYQRGHNLPVPRVQFRAVSSIEKDDTTFLHDASEHVVVIQQGLRYGSTCQ